MGYIPSENRSRGSLKISEKVSGIVHAVVAQLVECVLGNRKLPTILETKSSIPDNGSKSGDQNTATKKQYMDDIEILALKFYDYSKFIRGYSKETIRRYKSVIQFYSHCAHITQIGQVNEGNVRAFFFYGRTQRNWSTNTFISYHKSLLVFFRWCVE